MKSLMDGRSERLVDKLLFSQCYSLMFENQIRCAKFHSLLDLNGTALRKMDNHTHRMMKDRRSFVSRACDPFRKRVTTEKKEETMAVDAPLCIALLCIACTASTKWMKARQGTNGWCG